MDKARKRDKKFLTEPEAYQIFQDYGLNIAPYRFVEKIEEAKNAADAIGYPLVAKVVSEEIVHKSDTGGVVTNIQNETDLVKAIEEIHEKVNNNFPEANIKGILLQKMVREGVEFIIGARFSEKYGHLLMFGLGGVFVEVLRDVTFRRTPLSKSEAMAMVEGIRSKKVLEGLRGNPAPDKAGIADYLLRISQLVSDFPQIKEIDINPVFGLEKSVVVADARIIVKD